MNELGRFFDLKCVRENLRALFLNLSVFLLLANLFIKIVKIYGEKVGENAVKYERCENKTKQKSKLTKNQCIKEGGKQKHIERVSECVRSLRARWTAPPLDDFVALLGSKSRSKNKSKIYKTKKEKKEA